MKPKKNIGKFIVIDGVDGSGKSTQRELLVKTLRLEGYECEIVDFPQYGQKSAGAVEEYLSGKYGMLNPYIASIFYAVDRFDASFKIRAWLDAGKIVISDRYVTANAGHQGGKIDGKGERIKFFKWLSDFEYTVLGIPKPDLNIILHMPFNISYKLLSGRKDKKLKFLGKQTKDIHEKSKDHLRRAEKTFVEIAGLFPNTRMVECTEDAKLLEPNQIHNKVWNLVRRSVLSTKHTAGIFSKVQNRLSSGVKIKVSK